ncbi:MAG: right-handed parallel beta-helix repeat-containing protein [Chitinophagaceae bacterium]|nr:right-handed parallel beta-helix repeat-containing protein [Chitinophagaceae bacterium]
MYSAVTRNANLRSFAMHVFFASSLLFFNSTAKAVIYYVDAARPDNSGSGTSWATAKKDLQEAIDIASEGDQVWVKAGEYRPTKPAGWTFFEPVARDYSFVLKNGVAVYGGFAGNETSLGQRNVNNLTLLRSESSSTYGASFHVVISVNDNSSTRLDGFTIAYGHARLVTGSPVLDPNYNSVVEGRTIATSLGGGLHLNNTNVTIANCRIQSNQGYSGGGVSIINGSSQIINCIIAGNIAQNGGGINSAGGAVITNCTISGNNTTGSSISGGIRHLSGSLTLNNTIADGNKGNDLSGSVQITNSLVEQSLTETYHFVNAPRYQLAPFTGGDYRLNSCSEAVNGGDNLLLSAGFPLDVEGQPRIQEGTIDIGAIEYQPVAAPREIFYVNGSVASSGNGRSWASAYKTIDEALRAARFCDIDTIFVARGTYRPERDIEGNLNPVNENLKTFYLNSEVKLFGGFLGNETYLGQRNVELNETVLYGLNRYHILLAVNNTENTIIDGFSITGGTALSGTVTEAGNFQVPNSTGAGLVCLNANPVVRNCRFQHCEAFEGGAVYAQLSSPFFMNCIIAGNRANNKGAAMSIQGGVRAMLVNCTFSGNFGQGASQGIFYVNNNDIVISDCIFWGNDNFNGPLRFVSANPEITNSIIQGGFFAPGVLNVDPEFVSAPAPGLFTGGDYRLQLCSPAINAGSGFYLGLPQVVNFDLQGSPRVLQNFVDIGAYEQKSVRTLYVNAAVAASGDGLTWSTAIKTIEEALQDASICTDSIFVAAGTYYPTRDPFGNLSPADPRDKTFLLKNNLGIYGGFAGTEKSLSERNLTANTTILSGDIGTAGVNTDNCYHVVTSVSDNGTAVLDGFTVTGGNANGTGNILVEGWSVLRNYGGGMQNTNSSPAILNCSFKANTSSANGGGISIYNQSSPTLNNCSITGNVAADGGGLNIDGTCSPLISNCTIAGNRAIAGGGMVIGNSSSPQIVNCIVYDNSSGIVTVASSPVINYSNVQGAAAGTGNLAVHPAFINSPSSATAPFTGGNYRLQFCSPSINAGTNTAVSAAGDIDGNARIAQEVVDMGAWENVALSTTRFYVNTVVAASGDGLSWATAFKTLGEALESARNCSSIDTIFVAKGTYFPTHDATGNNSPADPRNKTFYLRNTLRVIGGFAGTETSAVQRNLALNPTILSGDIGTTGDRTDNCYHVLLSVNDGNTTLLDGFIIRDGNANGAGTVSVEGFNIRRDFGGGIQLTNSSPSIRYCHFAGNTGGNGGAISCFSNSSPTVLNCLITGNSATNGGGLNCETNSSPLIVNSTIAGNNAVAGGAFVLAAASNPVITNTIIYGNNGSFVTAASTPVISFSTVEGGFTGSSISTNNPLFINSPSFTTAPFITGDYRLQHCSPDFNAGNNTASISNNLATDLLSAARIQQTVVDKGAYENAVVLPSFKTYVNGAVPVSGDGLSWNTAYKTLGEALQSPAACGTRDTIFVAAGTYYPEYDASGNASPADPRDRTFYLRSGYKLFGGFAGNETALSQRNLAANPTILSGDLGSPGGAFDNSYHVVMSLYDNTNTILDGFIISDGNANGIGTLAAENTNVERNGGGGVYSAYSFPGIRNCIITGNAASFAGAGVFNTAASPKLINCVIAGNRSENFGGGVYNANAAAPQIVNVSMAGNYALSGGGMANVQASAPVVTNSIIYDNSNGVYNEPAAVPAFSYCILQNTTAGAGNSTANPQFDLSPSYTTAPFTANINFYKVSACSPAINTGNNAAVPAGTTTDITGVARIQQAAVDIGAYESVLGKFKLYVDGNVPASGNGLTWSTAFKTLGEALEYARNCNNADSVFVAANTYYPVYDPTGSATPADARTKTFYLRNGLKVFGGFAGGETHFSQRNLALNRTTLSGDIGVSGNRIDNTYHVVTSVSDDNSTELDGFFITGGNADVAANLVSEGELVFHKQGGGLCLISSALVVRNCSVVGNAAGTGGGISIYKNSMPLLVNDLFAGNTATDGAGAAIEVNSAPVITNCTFAGNNSGTGGGLFVSNNSAPVISNSIIYGNSSGISAPGNPGVTVRYCTVQDGYPGTANSNANPLFVSNPLYTLAPLSLFTMGDYRLSGCSPAINTGNNTYIPAGVSTDIIGAARVQQVTVDKGAYENVPAATPSVLYVNLNAAAGGNGQSWATAYRSLADALQLANNCPSVSSIYVAAGIYLPGYDLLNNAQPADARDKTFFIRNGLKLYGGFAGFESTPADRNMAANISVLSGDLGLQGTVTDNSYHVVTTINDGASTEIDGFTITGGNCNGAGSVNAEATAIARNLGGGIYAAGYAGKITNCIITGNSGVSGAGIFNTASSPAITNCVVAGNKVSNLAGGIYNFNTSSPRIVNSTIAGNSAASAGAGILNEQSSAPIIINSIIYGNSTSIQNVNASSATITYSDVEGGFAGTGNINADPQFLNAPSYTSAPFSNGNFKPGACSPALNSGNNAGVPAGILTDIISQNRIQEGVVNMGAYENTASGLTIYVNAAVPASGNGLNWANAFKTLEEALAYSRVCTGADTILVAQGTYYPTHDPFGNASPADPRDKTFLLNDGVKIFGGFGGFENNFSERNLAGYPVILSGDIGVAGNLSDNTYHVVTSVSDGNTTKLDGLTILYGNANGTGNILVEGWAVLRNYGGGIQLTNSSPAIVNCRVMGNNGVSGGGAASYNNSSPVFTSCIISGNTATAGGAVFSEASSNTFLINSTISGNNATTGGAFRNIGFSNIQVHNSIISGNSSTMVSSSSSPVVSYSIIEGGFTGSNNNTDDPLFLNAPSYTTAPFTVADYRVKPCSPAVNTGVNVFVNPLLYPTDIDGKPRIFESITDRGAYETVGEPFVPVLYESATAATQCNTRTVSGGATRFFDNNCQLLVTVTPSGAAPVNGVVNTCVVTNDLAGSLPLYNGNPYLTRHFDIEPTVGAATATATVKLFYTQAEFDNYNTKKAALYPALPTGPADASGKAALRITQYHGTPTQTPSIPGAYTNPNGILIDPVDSDIVWNGNYWEVSIQVTGFSGFYISTFSGVLPLQILHFSGTHQPGTNLLKWKVDCDNATDGLITLEKSPDGVNFYPVHTVAATGSNCNVLSQFADNDLQQQGHYYRLKITANGGRIIHSQVVMLKEEQNNSSIAVIPNPVTGDNIILQLNGIPAGPFRISITDMTGKVVLVKSENLLPGQQQVSVAVGNIAKGSYQVITADRNGVLRAARILKL